MCLSLLLLTCLILLASTTTVSPLSDAAAVSSTTEVVNDEQQSSRVIESVVRNVLEQELTDLWEYEMKKYQTTMAHLKNYTAICNAQIRQQVQVAQANMKASCDATLYERVSTLEASRDKLARKLVEAKNGDKESKKGEVGAEDQQSGRQQGQYESVNRPHQFTIRIGAAQSDGPNDDLSDYDKVKLVPGIFWKWIWELDSTGEAVSMDDKKKRLALFTVIAAFLCGFFKGFCILWHYAAIALALFVNLLDRYLRRFAVIGLIMCFIPPSFYAKANPLGIVARLAILTLPFRWRTLETNWIDKLLLLGRRRRKARL